MALKDLLVYVDQTESAEVRLRLAVDLACRHASHLTALFVKMQSQAQVEACNTAELGLVSAVQLQDLYRGIDATISGAENRLRATLGRFEVERDLKVEWRCVEGFPAVVVPQHIRYSDLCILGHDDLGERGPIDYSFSEHVLFVAGRPILLVPTSGSFNTLGRNIVVAWNSSRPASRALNDAIGLIEHAEKATVLAVNPAHYNRRHGALPPEQLIEHLRRHGISADVVRIEHVPTESIADVLQDRACELGADLLVAGAFGHTRLREKLLGGVTCKLLEHMRLPILMSH